MLGYGGGDVTLTLALSHQGRGDLRFHPHPDPLPSRERGFNPHPSPLPSAEFNRRALFFSGFPPPRERRGLVANGSPSPLVQPSPIEGEGICGVFSLAIGDRGVGDTGGF